MVSKFDTNISLFRKATKDSYTISDVLRKMGYKISGGAFRFFRQKAKQYNIDYSHFVGQSWSRGLSRESNKAVDQVAVGLEKPWKEVFCKNSTYNHNQYLIKKLLRAGKRIYQCEKCGLTEWQGEKLVLHMHHKNGESSDNREENLEILCPNCHSQRHNNIKRVEGLKLANEWRKKPRPKQRKVDRPTKTELTILKAKLSWTAIGKKFGVSDNAVRKWAKRYEIIK
jgi:Zn finger protein HypA/HybF involved in hydrogenase expression